MSEQPEVQADPVVKVARDLTEIAILYGELEDQARELARARVDGTSLPGGRAMVALAPVGSPDEWAEQIAYEELRHLSKCPKADHKECRYAEHAADGEDDTSPLQTLLFWSEQWREIHGSPLEGRKPTEATEANFIRWALNWAWDNEPNWDDFAADVRQTRVRLESLLYAGKHAERTRVTCTNEACERKPRLIRVYADDAVNDHFKCTACKTRYDQKQFARAQLQHLHSEGADRHVKLQDAMDAIDRPRSTWAKWLRYWYVRSYRDRVTGQRWVWWPDVREMDKVTPRRNRNTAA